MPHDDDDFSGDVWDEYQWERFLQEQDRNTEKYFNLLEKFVDHPERDELIAREMGWDACADDSEIEEFADLNLFAGYGHDLVDLRFHAGKRPVGRNRPHHPDPGLAIPPAA